MKRNQVLAVLLILCLQLTLTGFTGVRAQAQYSLGLQGVTWNHSTISVQINPQEDAPWWQPYYINATLRAIGEWNDALTVFAVNYSDFSYLSSLMIVPTVSNATNSTFDVYVSWTEISLSNSSDDIGLTTTMSESSGVIINCTTVLASKSQSGEVLNEVDIQNVALHELGHCLGLRHSNYTGDLMYPTYALGGPIRAISVLDAYGVAAVFRWMQRQLIESSITLPSNIEYQYLPISDENLPPLQSSPASVSNTLQTVLYGIVEFVMSTEFLVLVLLVIIGLLVAALLFTTRRRRKEGRTHGNPSQSKNLTFLTYPL